MSQRAHRVSFFLTEGFWPDGIILHKCDNRLCVRPSHHRDGTKQENAQDAIDKGRMFAPVNESKFTDEDIEMMALRYESGDSAVSIARSYKCSPGYVRTLVRGFTQEPE